MSTKPTFDTVLSCLLAGLFLWFFASSVSIAYHKAPQHDDAMFATIPKNFLGGYGWATSYGEKIPFNPDISTGPTLLLPAAAMIAVVGNTPWAPAMTGTCLNIALVLLILLQLRRHPHVAQHALALLLALSLFAVNDFKTFTGYYTTALLFLAALLFSLDTTQAAWKRFLCYGAAAAAGLYGKPLILLSFALAWPALLYHTACRDRTALWRLLALTVAGFVAIFLPWQLYRLHVLSTYPAEFRAALEAYGREFVAHHGTGLGQLVAADDRLLYLKQNAVKNFRLLSRFLRTENGFPFVAVLVAVVTALTRALHAAAKRDAARLLSFPVFVPAVLAVVIAGNILWYVGLSFAMTPGHTFFLTFFSFLLLFLLLAHLGTQRWHGLLLCCLGVLCFPVRQAALVEAYSFRAADILDNAQIQHTLDYLEHTPHRYPLASCGYLAAPYRLEYLMPGSQNFVDCYNVLQDALTKDTATGQYRWTGAPDFTFAFEGLNLLAAAHSQGYVLEPISDICLQHLLFHGGIYYVCEVSFSELREKLDPTETAKQLTEYRRWYKTRIRPGE